MTKRDPYLISVDGGGTKTLFCAYNLSHGIRSYYRTGSTNYKTIGHENTRKNLLLGFLELKKDLNIEDDDVEGCVFGLSGCDSDEDFTVFSDLVAGLGLPSTRCYLCNDSELAFYAQGASPGLVVICGTGSIVLGFGASGQSCRAGGWGNHVSDLGSGYWMGAQALQAALLYADGCIPFSPLFEKIKDHYKVSSFESLPDAVTNLEVFEIAGVAKTVVSAAGEGDAFALDLSKKAVKHLALLAKTVYDKLLCCDEVSVDIVLSGGLFENPCFKSLLKQQLIEGEALQNLNFPENEALPVDGGIEIGLHKFVSA